MLYIRYFLAALLALSFGATGVLAADEESRPKIGLVLSGGGARGGAHVGVLKALEEMEIPVDYIAGTSMGAIIGGMYSSGYNADEINEVLTAMDWTWAMSDRPNRKNRTMRKKELEAQFLVPYRLGFNDGKIQIPLGAIEGQHLDQVFNDILMPVIGITDFDELPIPFRAVATDLVTGDAVVFGSGNLSNVIRASMSVPGVFAPVEIDGKILVDGGMANNLPVDVVREMGADIVIAVDISSPLLKEEQLTSVLSVTEQLTNFLTRRTTEAQIALLGDSDVLIVPPLDNFSAADFQNAAQIVKLGYEASMNSREELARLSAPQYANVSSGPENLGADFIVEFIDIVNGSVLNDEIIRSRLKQELGQPLDSAALNRSLDNIYSLDVFESVTYDLVSNEQGQKGIQVNALPRSWGPNYLQFGLELSSDFSGNSEFKLGAAYTRNALNPLGGELRVIASLGREDELSFDFYQPIDSEAMWFVRPQVSWRRESYRLWVEDINVAELEFDGWNASLGLGRNLSTSNRLQLNYEFGREDADVLIGDPDLLGEDNIEIGEIGLEYLHDSLDSFHFPTSGMLHRVEYLMAREGLGAYSDYEQALANGSISFSRGINTLLWTYELGYSFDDKAPIERWFRLGGFGRLSGLAPDQLLGRNVMLGTLTYYRRLNTLDLLSAYAGMTLEAGNVWELSDDISFSDLEYAGSLFLGADTPLGPVYLAVGHGSSGDTAAYFYVGNPFRVNRFD